MADRFYVNCPLAPGAVSVQGAEAHHLAGVRRFHAGDVVCLFNGDGHEYPARVTAVDRHSVQLDVLGQHSPQRELPVAVEIAVPLPRGDRAQFLMEKLTELGVTTFVPLRTLRSVVQPRENKREKLQRYVIEASKQCGRNVLLAVKPPVDWESYCRRDNLPALRILAHPGEPPLPWQPAQAVALAVGPEGGFTAEEIAAAQAAGWRLAGLGPRILRVETAALVLAAWANYDTMGNQTV